MAEWRTRGYVVDSDDEDESQSSLAPIVATGEEAAKDNDDHRDRLALGQYNDGFEKAQVHLEGAIDGIGEHGLTGQDAWRGSDRPGSKTIEHDGLGKSSAGEAIDNGTAGEGSAASVTSVDHKGQEEISPQNGIRNTSMTQERLMNDDGEVDELQDDYYQHAPTVHIESEHAQEARNSIMPGRSSSSAQSRDSSRYPSSLPHVVRSTSEASVMTDAVQDGNVRNGEDKLELEISQERSVISPYVLIQSPPAASTTSSIKVTRTLRQRNPIQLHPYAIESENYRQVLKARGVKPLRIAQTEAQVASPRREESQNVEHRGQDSQDLGRGEDQENLRSSSPVVDHESPVECVGNRTDILVFGDDDLPDTNTFFADPSRRHVGNGYKRRKIAPVSFRMPAQMSREIHKPKENVSPTLLFCDDDDLMFSIPPSPPHSRSRTPPPVSRALRQSPQNALPTPVTSSEPRHPHVLEISDEDLPTRPVPIRLDSRTSSDESDPGNTSVANRSSHQLQRVQRKIRGVLPASWLKLDLKSQKKRPQDGSTDQRNPSPERNPAQRGIARPIEHGRSRFSRSPTTRNDTFVLSDSEESASGRSQPPRQQPLEPKAGLIGDEDDAFLEDRWGEAAENDKIDAMLPTTRRRTDHPRKQQTKREYKRVGYEPRSRSMTHEQQEALTSHRSHRPRIAERSDKGKNRKPKFRPPKLSILDASSLDDPSKIDVPPFLKIAARTARSRKDQGNHSPTRKYLKLATPSDDADTNNTLRDWRQGTIAPTTKQTRSSDRHRQPLRPRSANNAAPSKIPQISKKSSDTRNPLYPSPTEPRLMSTGRRKFQTSLDRLLEHRLRRDAGAEEKSQANLVNENSKKRGQLVSSIRASKDARPAMLEMSRVETNGIYARTGFQQDLSRINHFDDASGLSNVLRLIEEDKRQITDVIHPQNQIQGIIPWPKQAGNAPKMPVVHKRRKRRPQHKAVSAPWSRPSSVSSGIDAVQDAGPSRTVPETSKTETLTGLGPFGTNYSDDFDITPVPIGTYFNEATYIGSGLFTRSMKLAGSSSLDKSRGYALFQVEGKSYSWGPWNDDVSSGLGEIMDWMNRVAPGETIDSESQTATNTYQHVIPALQRIVMYFSEHLSFLDSIDRLSCVQRCRTLVATLSLKLGDLGIRNKTVEQESMKNLRLRSVLQFNMMTLVFANQIRQISMHELIPIQLQDESQSLVESAAQTIMALATTAGFVDFQGCRSLLEDPDANGYVVQDDNSAIETFVVAHHILFKLDKSVDFWRFMQVSLQDKTANGILNIQQLEIIWKRLFTLLPFHEFDTNGVIETGRRFQVAYDGWTVIKQLTNPVLKSSLANPRGQEANFNAYCRVIFRRCLHLVNAWGWRQCDSIIGTLFDYFARNNLGHLRNEESHGSPRFLEQLAEEPSLAPDPNDRCFHTLLKIIGSGIRYMRQSCSEKKLRDLVWRLMPNHGRSHPKEEAIHQADLDALRNHHDLLCTLYWASPSSCRPRLTVIRNLVHLESSHREACHINIRAWFNLVKFQLSTDEPTESLAPLTEWHDDVLVQILRQHGLARTEAEDYLRSVQYPAVTHELLESTIRKNQQQVEAVLGDALVSLKLAIDSSHTEQAATALLSPATTRVFDLFDAGRPQNTKTVIHALDVLSACANKSMPNYQSGSHRCNDDSQDYGDWPSFEDDNEAPAVVLTHDVELYLQRFQEPLKHLLSDCFGADTVPGDSLLLKVVDVWVEVAQLLVHKGVRAWNDYVDRFGHDSWSFLRDTEQARKYTVYYYAKLIEADSNIYSEHTMFFMTTWVGSLVERESLLKFQHRLTAALLNIDSSNPLLKNLPFWFNTSSGCYQISTADFSERRLSLISCVLSNMRLSLETAVFNPSVNTAQLRQEYKDLLRHIMGTMKHNYQELGQGSHVTGTYVGFVHQVIEFLQQHTSAICPIDRFFTDNGAFPLPATDPTYVVGQLKNYALRLQESRTPKQLAVFLQSVSERAAIDGQQMYLVDQLHTAMSNAFEDGVSEKITLRSFLIKAIIPAYIELACTSAGRGCGWILAIPFLQALQKVFKEIPLDLDGANPDSVGAVISTITAFLDSVRRAFGTLNSSYNSYEDAGILKLISVCFATVTALLPSLDYLVRLSGETHHAVEDIAFVKGFAVYISARLHNHGDDGHELQLNDTEDPTYADTRNFATQELRDSLVKSWTHVRSGNQYYFTRGSSRREVEVDAGLYEEEKAQLFVVLADFFDCLGAMPAFGDEDECVMIARRKRVVGLDQLVF